MKSIGNTIANRLSLRSPQRESLEILDRVCDLLPLSKDQDAAQALAAIRAEFANVTDFERDFPSLCFALATGVGKTRLMGAFIAYLHRRLYPWFAEVCLPRAVRFRHPTARDHHWRQL